MKTTDKKELRGKTANEILKMVTDLQADMQKYKLEKAQNKLKNTSSLTNARRMIAIMKTVLKEKELIKNG